MINLNWINLFFVAISKPYSQLLYVECIPSEEIIRIVFKPYSYGTAPVLILNCLTNELPVIVNQNEERLEKSL
jgi:hypothetical protein